MAVVELVAHERASHPQSDASIISETSQQTVVSSETEHVKPKVSEIDVHPAEGGIRRDQTDEKRPALRGAHIFRHSTERSITQCCEELTN
jgi:hypothetical protein